MRRSRRLFARIGQFVQANPVKTLLLAVLLIGVAGVGAGQIVSVTGDRAFVAEEPTLDTFNENFDRDSVALLVRGDVTEPSTMQAIDRYDRRMSEVEDVQTVNSPADRVRAEYGYIPESEAKIEAVVGTPETTVVNVVTEPGLTQEESRPIYGEAT